MQKNPSIVTASRPKLIKPIKEFLICPTPLQSDNSLVSQVDAVMDILQS